MHMMMGNYMPFILRDQGYAVQAIGGVLTAYLLAGAIGSFAGGALAERISGRAMSLYSGVLATLLLAPAFLLTGPLSVVLMAVGSFALISVLPVNIAMAQELCPRETSTVSALLMGFAWGVGSLGPPLAEPLTRVIGFRWVLVIAALLPLLTSLLALYLPREKRARMEVMEKVPLAATPAGD
jgi:FSR family fosmidomycin resistance protein-like MFS transporter